MKKSELKMIIKECVKEILFEEGVLSSLVAEVALGITKAQSLIVEQEVKKPEVNLKAQADAEEERRKKVLETKRKMLDAMGNNSKMKNVFEGTEPLRSSGASAGTAPTSPLAGRAPGDSGVDISNLFNLAGQKWNALK